MDATELTTRINTLAREIWSGAYPRPAARRALLTDYYQSLSRLIGNHEAREVLDKAWAKARA